MEVVAPVSPDLLRHGLESHRRGDFDQAARCYQQACRRADVRGCLALARRDCSSARRPRDRSDHIRRALRSTRALPVITAIWLWRAALWDAVLRHKRPFGPRSNWTPSSSGMRLNLANILKDASKFDDAAHEYRLALDQQADHSGTWSGLGDALSRRARRVRGIAALSTSGPSNWLPAPQVSLRLRADAAGRGASVRSDSMLFESNQFPTRFPFRRAPESREHVRGFWRIHTSRAARL